MLPQKIKLTEQEASKGRELNDRAEVNLRNMEKFRQETEQRGFELKQETNEWWSLLAKKYDLDLENVNYTLSADGNEIVPLQMKFV
jgi:hypothetical protein